MAIGKAAIPCEAQPRSPSLSKDETPALRPPKNALNGGQSPAVYSIGHLITTSFWLRISRSSSGTDDKSDDKSEASDKFSFAFLHRGSIIAADGVLRLGSAVGALEDDPPIETSRRTPLTSGSLAPGGIMRITRIVIGTAAVLLAATSVLAQDRRPIPRGEMDKYVISAKAGVVNLVEGDARVIRARPFAIPEILISGDELQGGDIVKTSTNGRAEILLNPGCYLRLGAESEFVFLFDNFTSDKLKLLRGSAVLEASAIESSVTVETPKAKFEIARDGLYRFNISPDGKTEVAVHKGRVLVGVTTIKEGKRAVVEGGTVAIAKLNKQDADVLDDWSKDRSKALIAANSRLSNVGMSRTLGMSFMRNAWIFDPFCRCYTFLPFAGGFTSPYGWDYPVCNPYGYYYSRPRYNNGGWTGGGSTGSGSRSGGGSSGSGGNSGGEASKRTRGEISYPAPRGGSIGGDGGSGGGGGVRQPPPSPPSPQSGVSPVERGGSGTSRTRRP